MNKHSQDTQEGWSPPCAECSPCMNSSQTTWVLTVPIGSSLSQVPKSVKANSLRPGLTASHHALPPEIKSSLYNVMVNTF